MTNDDPLNILQPSKGGSGGAILGVVIVVGMVLVAIAPDNGVTVESACIFSADSE